MRRRICAHSDLGQSFAVLCSVVIRIDDLPRRRSSPRQSLTADGESEPVQVCCCGSSVCTERLGSPGSPPSLANGAAFV